MAPYVDFSRAVSVHAGRRETMAERASVTIRPSHRAGPLPEDPIYHHWKAGPGGRSTTREGQPWKSTIYDNGKPGPVACPKCGTVIMYDPRGVVSCWEGSWSLTRKEREELEARDPEMIPIFQYLERMEQYTPRFEGHVNNRKISGKDRREKRFLSKCAAVS